MLSWETTNDDLKTVLERHGIIVNKERLEEIGDLLNADDIAQAAICGDDIDEQTNYAYGEIESQLIEAKILPADAERFWE